jgi:hypothetical protein
MLKAIEHIGVEAMGNRTCSYCGYFLSDECDSPTVQFVTRMPEVTESKKWEHTLNCAKCDKILVHFFKLSDEDYRDFDMYFFLNKSTPFD